MERPPTIVIPESRKAATSRGQTHVPLESSSHYWISQLGLILLPLFITGCGTYTLGNVHPQANKSADQQQLDTLTCKDQANLAVNNGARQTGDFLLGMTIVGAPVAYEMDKSTARDVFASCMQARGYVVTPTAGATQTTASTPAPGSNPVPAVVVPGVDQLALALSSGFALKAVPAAWKSKGIVFYAINRTLDLGVIISADRHEGITDLMAYAMTKRASQSDRLKDSSISDLTHLEIGGHPAVRYDVTGTINNVKITYVTTIIEGHDQIVLINAWTGAANAIQQRTVLESVVSTVSGIS